MMKKLKGSIVSKIIALILFCALGLTLLASAVVTLTLDNWDAYNEDYKTVRVRAMNELAWNQLYMYADMYQNGLELEDLSEDTNFRISISDTDGKRLFSNYKSEEIICRVITDVGPSYHIEYSNGAAGQQEISYTVVEHRTGDILEFESQEALDEWKKENSLHLTGYVLAELTVNDSYAQRDWLLSCIYPYRYELIGAAVVSALLLIVLLVFLISAAGHRKGRDEIVLSFVDKVPLDVFVCCAIVAGFMPISIASELGLGNNIISYVVVGLLTVWLMAVLALSATSLAVRIKSGTFWKNCLCIMLCCWCWRVLKKLLGFALAMLKSLSMSKRFVVIVLVTVAIEFFLVLLSGLDAAMTFFLWILNLIALIVFFAYLVYCFEKLRRGAKELASGSLSCSIDTRFMRGVFLEHANDMMNIRSGMNRAVNERMKSERFQSELITNVSHDIKTPLTSIVNYVDLLEKEELDNPRAKEYVEVLSRQSAKLKKLIGDLIEASKASTGVLAVNEELMELNVLLDQCAGEYRERLEKAGLSLVVTKPEESVCIMADGRHMWRIFDNLMGNVLKYAQPGTRVYLSLSRNNGKALVAFRNISREALDMSGEELMERFVRGDSSRSTEGSGLGLAIARSLCQLQKGEMSLSVDGDLFKVVLSFDETK